MTFWENAKPRLDRLANRLDPKAVRMAIHKRIPWPMQAERDLAQARQDVFDWKHAQDAYVIMLRATREQIDAYRKGIDKLMEDTRELQDTMIRNTSELNAATQKLGRLLR
jgi:hypothetical protein